MGWKAHNNGKCPNLSYRCKVRCKVFLDINIDKICDINIKHRAQAVMMIYHITQLVVEIRFILVQLLGKMIQRVQS